MPRRLAPMVHAYPCRRRSRRKAHAWRHGNCSWLEQLPVELLDQIFRQVSGTFLADSYFSSTDLSFRRRLDVLSQWITLRSAEMAYVCRGWQELFQPTFHHYAVYDGGPPDALTAPESCWHHMRKLLVHIPAGFHSYRSVARALFFLPQDTVRRKVRWLGLCLERNTTISMSECGALAEAFPNLCRLDVDLSCLDAPKLRNIHPIVLGNESPAQMTTLVCRSNVLVRQGVLVCLIRRVSSSLEYLDLGSLGLVAACTALWSQNSTFPWLRVLRMLISSTDEVAGIPLPQPCLLPRLAALTFHIDVHKKARGRRGQAGAWNVDALLRFVDALLGSGPRLTLRRLSVDSIGGGAVLGLLRGSFPLLESLSLRQYSGPEKDSMQLSDALATIMDIPALKCYSNEVAVRTRYSFIDFDCLPAEAGIRILDISSWAVTLTDMQRLVARLPRLEEICLTLTNPDEHPQPKDIAYNLEMRRLWMNTIGGTDPAWTVEALDSLAAVVTRMPNLQELLLFDKAVRWLASAVAKQNSEELLSLAFTVNVGRCNCDERAVKSTTSLIL